MSRSTRGAAKREASAEKRPEKGPVYAYGIVGGDRAPDLGGAPAGVPDTGPLRVLRAADGIHVVVADADPEKWTEAAIEEGLRDMDWVSERAVRHDEVLAHFLSAPALVPMKAFTLFRSDERAIEHTRAKEKDVREVLARVAGCVEWGVRLRFEGTAPRAAPAAKPSSGAAFLQRKKNMQDAARNAHKAAFAAAREAAETIAALAKDTVLVPSPEVRSATPLLLEIALLVPRGKSAALEKTVAALAPELGKSAVGLELTGPWAPFHFAGERK
jgi:hypothetical protein